MDDDLSDLDVPNCPKDLIQMEIVAESFSISR